MRNVKNNRYQYAEMKTFPKGAIGGLTKKLASFRFTSNNTTNDNQYDKTLIFAREIGLSYSHNESACNGDVFLFATPKKITAEQSNFGKAWLKDYFFKKNGETRSGKRTEYVGTRVLEISKSVSKFEFVGVIGLMNSYGDYIQFIPLYRTYNRKGQYFDYAPIHWGQPVIIEGL
jgi:hypothetical protein